MIIFFFYQRKKKGYSTILSYNWRGWNFFSFFPFFLVFLFLSFFLSFFPILIFFSISDKKKEKVSQYFIVIIIAIVFYSDGLYVYTTFFLIPVEYWAAFFCSHHIIRIVSGVGWIFFSIGFFYVLPLFLYPSYIGLVGWLTIVGWLAGWLLPCWLTLLYYGYSM